MAHITRIKAKDAQKPDTGADTPPKKASKKPSKPAPTPEKTAKKPKKEVKKDKKKKPFFLFRPFIAFGRYLRDSWRELRQVRWPGRKATWKMTLAVLVYCALFLAFIVALDALFTLIFNNLLR